MTRREVFKVPRGTLIYRYRGANLANRSIPNNGNRKFGTFRTAVRAAVAAKRPLTLFRHVTILKYRLSD